MNGLALVASRPLLVERPTVRIPLLPGDRVVAVVGLRVAPGDLLAERVRDASLVEAGDDEHGPGTSHPGSWIPAGHGRRGTTPAGELLFVHGGRRRIATGPHLDVVSTPASGRVAAIRPGVEIVLDFDGIGIPGSELIGDPGHGRLAVVPGEGDGRIPLEVAHAGAIVVLPGRADAETLIRARAMGIAGAVVPSLSERDRRDVAASTVRQRAGMHRLAPFPVLVLDGCLRRSLAGPFRALFAALDGVEVGLVGNPPALVTAPGAGGLPLPGPDRIRVRGGREAGRDGRFLELAGPFRHAAGIAAESARVLLDDGRTVVVALGDLERFV